MTSTDEKLNHAWGLISIRSDERFNDEGDPIPVNEYIENQYDVNAESIQEMFEALVDGEELSVDTVASMFYYGFELGKVHERLEDDLNLLGDYGGIN